MRASSNLEVIKLSAQKHRDRDRSTWIGHWLAVILLVLSQFTVIPIMAMMVTEPAPGRATLALHDVVASDANVTNIFETIPLPTP